VGKTTAQISVPSHSALQPDVLSYSMVATPSTTKVAPKILERFNPPIMRDAPLMLKSLPLVKIILNLIQVLKHY